MDRAAIGIDLGGTKILAGLVTRDGVVGRRSEVPTDTSSTGAILAQIVALVRVLAEGAGDIEGVGVGIPATIDQTRGALVHAVNVPLADTPIRDLLAAETGRRVVIDNDGNCAALGEHAFGAAAPYPHSVMLTLGTGVGGGVIIDDRVFRGAAGAGGELGHMVIDRNGPPCHGTCPGRGHLEVYCSGTGLSRAAAAHLAAAPESAMARALPVGVTLDARFVLDRLAAGDEDAALLLDQVGTDLGRGLVSLANAFASSVFVIGGGFGEAAFDHLVGPAQRVLAAEALRPMNATPIVPALLGGDAGMIGAAELLHVPSLT